MTTTVETVQAVVIPVEGKPYATDIPTEDSLSVLQGLVGGLIEPIRFEIDGEEVTGFVNETGKFEQLPLNLRSTQMVGDAGALFWGDWVAGDMVIVGPPSRTGDETSCPLSVRQVLVRED